MLNVDMNAFLQAKGERSCPFKNLVDKLADAFLKMLQSDPEIPMRVICSPISSPTLQIVLITLAMHNRYLIY